MTISVEILKLWKQHSAAAFPKEDKEIDGINVSLLDTEIAGCVHMFIHNGGRLDYQRVLTLRDRLIDLNTIILFLDKDELDYFNRLRELANLILQEAENN
jgi:hypothetical protein